MLLYAFKKIGMLILSDDIDEGTRCSMLMKLTFESSKRVFRLSVETICYNVSISYYNNQWK